MAEVRVDHHGAFGMPVAKRGELFRGTAEVERASRIEIRHQHALLGVQDLRRLAHEAHARDHQRRGFLGAAEACHLQRIGDAAAGLLGEVLDVGLDVIMREKYRAPLCEQPPDALLQFPAFFQTRRVRHSRPRLRGTRDSGELALEFNDLDSLHGS